MADLTDDRGQLLLVTGFAIAVTIVALVLLLNTAIYTENLATRDVDTGASDALALRDTVEDDLWGVVEGAAHNGGNETNSSAVEDDVSQRVDRFENLSARHTLATGASADIEVVAFHDGARVRQTDPDRNLTSVTNDSDWRLADDADGVRRFELNTTGGLESTPDPENESFRVDVVGSGGNRSSLYVYDDTDGDPTIAVKNGSESISTDVCGEYVSGPPRVGLRAGTVNGADCDAIDFAKNTTPPYDVEIAYGNRSRGTYDGIVNGSAPAANFNTTSPLDSPVAVPVVYGLDAAITYQSATLTHRSRVDLPSGTVSDEGGALRFAKAPGETVRTSDGDVLEFRVENTADRQVTVERFSVDATGLAGGVAIDDGNAPEFDVQRTDVQNGEANRTGAFDADGTTYDFVADSDEGSGSQYATIAAGVDDAEVDVRAFSQDLGTMEVTYDENRADLTVTLVLDDGSEQEFYFHER